MNGIPPSNNNPWFRFDPRQPQPAFNFHNQLSTFPPIVVNPLLMNFGAAGVQFLQQLLPRPIPVLDPSLPLQNQTTWFELYSQLLGNGTSNPIAPQLAFGNRTSNSSAPQLTPQELPAAEESDGEEVEVLYQGPRINSNSDVPVAPPTLDANPIIQQAMQMPELRQQDNSTNDRSGQTVNGRYCKMPEVPCRVCLYDRSQCFHFGARACGACASFFSRSIIHKKQYFCRYNDNCHNAIRKNGYKPECQSCRFKNCLRVGMKPEFVHQRKFKYRRY